MVGARGFEPPTSCTQFNGRSLHSVSQRPLCLLSTQIGQKSVHYFHCFHSFHPICTQTAHENGKGDSIILFLVEHNGLIPLDYSEKKLCFNKKYLIKSLALPIPVSYRTIPLDVFTQLLQMIFG